jgi:GH15 family glucan-1,4-alpha-glucosidase
MFPPIAEYAFLSDCETQALIAADGTVEWTCLPRPDSPSVFGALLDRRAGFFRFGPTNAGVPLDRRYLPGTMITETTWHTPTGWLVVRDALVMGPVSKKRIDGRRRAPGDLTATGTLLRIATCTSGHCEVELNCLPLFEYGRRSGQWSYDGEGYEQAVVGVDDTMLRLTSTMQLGFVGQRAFCRTQLHQGDSTYVALSWNGDAPATLAEAEAQLARTERFWCDWVSMAAIPDHRFRPYIERSALALKGLSYAPTGAILAAATTSLPETLGGERNWDYRYTWIRDSSFMLRALHGLNLNWEAFEYFGFVMDAVTAGLAQGASGIQIMYGIGGERNLAESYLDHLSGYGNSKPVRIGNGAYGQRQHDVWGMLLDSVSTHMAGGGQIAPETWEVVATLVDEAATAWHEGDQGIWEMRGDPKHFVASKVMCWVAVDRGAVMARERGEDERAQRWASIADDIHGEVCAKGVDDRGVFKQHYDTSELDASLLLIPIMGFLPSDDERVRATVLAVADELTEDGLVLRYRVDKADDGLSNDAEGTFTICSFWLASALAMIGEVERARALFEKLLSFAGPLLLYAEEIDVRTGQHLGNFPQAFTHLALIDAANRLIEAETAAARAGQ